jgi:hypothetical protein
MPGKTAPDVIINAVQRAQEYNAKVMQFAAANSQASFDYLQKLAAVQSPSELVELTTTYFREQTDNLTAQAKKLAELAQLTSVPRGRSLTHATQIGQSRPVWTAGVTGSPEPRQSESQLP